MRIGQYMQPKLPTALAKPCRLWPLTGVNHADCGHSQVYWGNGCQIIPPHDYGIAASIEANLEPWKLPEGPVYSLMGKTSYHRFIEACNKDTLMPHLWLSSHSPQAAF